MEQSIMQSGTSDSPNVSEVVSVDPWEALKKGFQAVRLLKDATRLLGIQMDANAMKVELKEERNALFGKAQSASVPLEKLSLNQRVDTIDVKIKKIDSGLAAIEKRATELTKDKAAKA